MYCLGERTHVSADIRLQEVKPDILISDIYDIYVYSHNSIKTGSLLELPKLVYK